MNMKIHKIIFFVGVLLVVNQFLGIPSDIRILINVIFGVVLIVLGIYLKLQNLKKENSVEKSNIDHKIFVENFPAGTIKDDVIAESTTEYSPDNSLDENINNDIESLNNSDEYKDTQ
jgi:uncharacterized membrane protein